MAAIYYLQINVEKNPKSIIDLSKRPKYILIRHNKCVQIQKPNNDTKKIPCTINNYAGGDKGGGDVP